MKLSKSREKENDKSVDVKKMIKILREKSVEQRSSQDLAKTHKLFKANQRIQQQKYKILHLNNESSND